MTAVAVSPRAQQALAVIKAIVMDLLRIEAREQCVRDAELGAREGALDVSTAAQQWYGLAVNREEHQQLVAKRTVLEVQLRHAKEHYQAAEIRRDTSKADWREQILALREQLSQVDEQLWTLEQATVAKIEANRELEVEEQAVKLYERYLVLATSMPMNVYHPAVPAFFGRWVLRQQERGALALPEYALLVYVLLRDTVFTGVWNQPPVLEDDELPGDNPLAEAGRPRTKLEARLQELLDAQFVHENGDRRVDRDSQVQRLHYERLAAVKNGRRFTSHFDFEADPEYWGLPSLPGLVNAPPKPCAECGAPIVDRVVESFKDRDGSTWFRGVTKCDCTKELLTPAFSNYDDAYECLMQVTGNGANAQHFRRRRALQRAAANAA